ncbi:DUF3618 domain-containing protein [Longivirga aurantiaca]|uniref:DUF3618 domain-containing protein n=1 Tax=Longivirga aurantiaca TaxID=1837743 RepID=A0ABW1T4G4_9ACTN
MSDSTTAAVRDSADKAADSVKDAASSAKDDVKDAAATVEKKAATVEKKAASAADAPAAKADDAKAKAKGEKPKPPQRSVSEIQAELDATRDRLAGRIDDLQEYVTPRNVMNRQVDKVKGVFVDEFGGIKPDRVLIAAGVVVGLVVVLGVSRRRRSS